MIGAINPNSVRGRDLIKQGPLPNLGDLALGYSAAWVTLALVWMLTLDPLRNIRLSGVTALLGFLAVVLPSGILFAAIVCARREESIRVYLPASAMRRWWVGTFSGALAGWLGAWLLLALVIVSAPNTRVFAFSVEIGLRAFVGGLLAGIGGGAIFGASQWLLLRGYVPDAARRALRLTTGAAAMIGIPLALLLVYITAALIAGS